MQAYKMIQSAKGKETHSFTQLFQDPEQHRKILKTEKDQMNKTNMGTVDSSSLKM